MRRPSATSITLTVPPSFSSPATAKRMSVVRSVSEPAPFAVNVTGGVPSSPASVADDTALRFVQGNVDIHVLARTTIGGDDLELAARPVEAG